MQGYHEPVRCRKCSGRCCQIYLPKSKGGMFPADKMVLSKWHRYFHGNEENYGVKQLFDPLKVHATGNEHKQKELREQGTDPFSCEYLGEEGCRIPRPKRPQRCNSYRCLEWIRQL